MHTITRTATTTPTARSRDMPPADKQRHAAMTPTALDPASLLHLIWLASPALPVGGFSYSEGLEAAVEYAGIGTEARACDWLIDQLWLTQARADLAVLAPALAAWRAGDFERARALNDWVRTTRESSELRLQAEQMGKSMLDWLRNRHADDTAAQAALDELARMTPTWPIAFALAAAPAQASAREVALAFAFGWAENMVQAAIKAVPLGQSAGQRMLARLAAEIPAAVDHALQLGDEDRQAFAPMLAILSARHEAQYSRLFRS